MDYPIMTICPSCQVSLAAAKYPLPERFHASAECWYLYGEVSAYLLERADAHFFAQVAVDTYAAQHAGPQSKPITTAFALIGLYLFHEQGYTGREVQLAHMKLGEAKHSYPEFHAPSMAGTLTVRDILEVPAGDLRIAEIIAWSALVWQRWQSMHKWTARFCFEQKV